MVALGTIILFVLASIVILELIFEFPIASFFIALIIGILCVSCG